METKLSLAKRIAWLCYIIGGLGMLIALASYSSAWGKIFPWDSFAQTFILLIVGLVLDLLSDIGQRVHHLTKAQEGDYDPHA